MERTTDASSGAASHCVLWHAPGREVPERLRAALARRQLELTEASSSHEAIARVCRIHNTDDCELVILLMIEPFELDMPSEVFGVAKAHAPAAISWIYTEHEDGMPTLRAVEPDTDPAEWDAAEARRHTPDLRLVGDAPDFPRDPSPEFEEQAEPEPLEVVITGSHRDPIDVEATEFSDPFGEIGDEVFEDLTEDEIDLLMSDDPIDMGEGNSSSDRSPDH